MNARGAVLNPPDVQGGVAPEFHLRPLQPGYLGRPQAVAEGDQHERGIPVPMTNGLGRLDHRLELGDREIFPRPELGIRRPDGNLSVYVTRLDELQLRSHWISPHD